VNEERPPKKQSSTATRTSTKPAASRKAVSRKQSSRITAAHYREALESAADAVFFVGDDGRIISVNREAERLLGYPRGKLVGQPVEIVVPERLHDAYRAHFGAYFAAPRARVIDAGLELFARRRDGSEVPVEISLSPLQMAGARIVLVIVRDVSDRQRLEAALRQSEREARQRSSELEATFSAIADAIFVYDRAGTLISHNAAAQRLLGSDASPDVLALTPPVHGEGRRKRSGNGRGLTDGQSWLSHILRDGQVAGPASHTMQVTIRDGRELELAVTGAPLRAENGHVTGVVLVARDVTEQRRAERRTQAALDALLATTEHLARLPSELGAESAGMTTIQGTERELAALARVMLNCRAVSLARLELESLAIHAVAVAGIEQDREREWREALEYSRLEAALGDAAFVARLRAGAPFVASFEEITGGMSSEGVSIRLLVPMTLGGRLVGILLGEYEGRDVLRTPGQAALAEAVGRLIAIAIEWEHVLRERSAREVAEARLRVLQGILHALPSGVFLVRGHDARLVEANRTVARLWGATWPEGQPMADFLLTCGARILHRESGEDIPQSGWATLQAVRQHMAMVEQQVDVLRPDGSAVTLHIRALPLGALGARSRDPDGRASEPMAITVCEDISSMLEAEQAKDDFVVLAAHDLRRPVQAIRGYAETLIKGITNHDASAAAGETAPVKSRRGKRATQGIARQQQALESLLIAANRLSSLASDLMDVTHLQSGRISLEFATHDLGALARKVAASSQAATTRHTIHVEPTAEPIVARIDARRIEQVLTNLVDNAIKYSPDGGEIVLTVRASSTGDMAEVSVSDYGIGIPFTEQEFIFSRFSRATNARKQEIEGTGLGLYLCQQLVARHGGSIWFESEEGTGSTFTFAVPLAASVRTGEADTEGAALSQDSEP
jgi:PAS domain S-box-containing protein